MNTPEPCMYCIHCYNNVLTEDDPEASAECMKNREMGNLQCPCYEQSPGCYPMHDKARKIKDQSQACGAFIEWLQEEKRIRFGMYHEHDIGCYNDSLHRRCNLSEDYFFSVTLDVLALLYEFFGIDRDKFEQEKEEMLAEYVCSLSIRS